MVSLSFGREEQVRVTSGHPKGRDTRSPSDRRIGPLSPPPRVGGHCGQRAPNGPPSSPTPRCPIVVEKPTARTALAQVNIVYLITAGLIGILARLWTSRCGIGWSLPLQILACWPATNNTLLYQGRASVTPFMHIVRTKRLFLLARARLSGQPYRAQITYSVSSVQGKQTNWASCPAPERKQEA